jgi:hypothetical protein
MSLSVKVLLFSFLILKLVNNSSSTFEHQFLGNYLTDEEYKNRELCSSHHCILDNDRLFYSATQNSSILPCDDFKEFAMGTFLQYRALNER